MNRSFHLAVVGHIGVIAVCCWQAYNL